MTDIDRKPFWTQKKAWEPSLEQTVRPYKFENNRKIKSEVIPDDGTNGIEFFIAITLPQFTTAYAEQGWTHRNRYEQFTKVLNGDMRTTWEEVLESNDFKDDNKRTDANWPKAVDTLICKFLNCKKPRDVQWRWIENGYSKPPLNTAEDHFRRFKEIVRHAKVLPKGVKPDPSAEEQKEWYFRTYCKAHRHAFCAAGKELDTSTMEEVTEFMRLKHEADLNDGTLTRLMKAKNSRGDGSRTRDGREKPYRRSSRYRDDSPSFASYRDRKNCSRKSRDDRGYKKRDHKREDDRMKKSSGRRSNNEGFLRSDKRDCPKHMPCKHTWEECSENPANKKKVAWKKRESSHYQDGSDSGSESSRSNSTDRDYDSPSEAESGEENEEETFHVDTKAMESEESRIPRRKRIKKMREKLNKANPNKRPKKSRKRDKKKDKVKLTLPNTSEEEKDELAGSK